MARPNKNYEPKKEALVKLAFDLFIEQGYENTTITHIMRAAGLTKAGMYHYFSSKEEILDAAIDYGITQDIEETRKSMEDLSVEEKMLLFIRGKATPNEFMQNMFQVKQNSYAAYRIRERLVHAYIPVLEEILREGIEKGVYKTEYPRTTAEFMVLLAKALVEPNILPITNGEDLILRMSAFLQLMKAWLQPTPKHAVDITFLFEKIISELQRGQEKTI